MQLIQEKYKIEQSEDFKEIEFDLDKGNKALMIEMLHSNLYSNPIGSVIRELASNCIDAHTEAKITKPIEIEFRDKNKFTGDNQPCIIFRDHAGLLSPERFKKTYTQYFASTKRTDNNQIGGYGLGCKTPLAYTDSFNVHVIHNKVDYMYTIQKVGYGDIKLFLMHSEKTTEENMTEVIIYLNKPEDKHLFINEIDKQLLYFKNVKYVNITTCNVKILEETKDYIISTGQNFSETHLVVGNVPYKLDLSTLFPNYVNGAAIKFDPYLGSFAIKFDIGELSLSINRENIYYTEDTKKKIIAKINAISTDFSKEITASIKNAKNVIGLVNTLSVLKNNNYTQHINTAQLTTKARFCLYSTNFKTFMYHGYPIDYSFSMFSLFSVRLAKEGYGKSIIDTTDYVGTNRGPSQLNFLSPVYYTENGVLEKRKALSELRTIKSGFILIKELTPIVDASVFNKHHNTKYTQVELQTYYDTLKAEIIANSKDWDAVQIDMSLLDDSDQKAVMSQKDYRKINKLLFVKEVNYNPQPYNVDKRFTYKHSSVKSEELDKIKEYVVYGPTEESYRLITAASILHCIKDYGDDVRVFKVAKDNIDYFKDEKKMVSIVDFFDVKSEPLRRFYTAYKLSCILNNYSYLDKLAPFTSRIYKLYVKLKDYEKNNYSSYGFSSSMFKDTLVFCEQNDIYDTVIMAEAKEIMEYCDGLEVLNYLDYPYSGIALESTFVTEGICDILESKKKEITYTIRPTSHTQKARVKGKADVMKELVKLQGLTAYDSNKNDWNLLKADFYVFKQGEYLHRVVLWIERL